jgi:hypothetical protein
LSAAPDRVEAKTKLAEVYEITGQLQKALDLVNEGEHSLDRLLGTASFSHCLLTSSQ